MSAVAVVLGLLLVVSFIATYALGPLPDQEAQNEFQHELQVENQLARLQAVILSQTKSPEPQALMVSPLTLGSQPVPPFGGPSKGDLTFLANGTGPVLNNMFGTSIYRPPSWNNGSMCVLHTGSCVNAVNNQCNPPLTDNYSANNSIFSYTISGSGQCVRLNITGTNDQITVNVPIGGLKLFFVELYGTLDRLTLNYGGSNFNSTLWVFGSQNTVNFTATGSHDQVGVKFVGESSASTLCPSGNLTVTDSANAFSTGTGNLLNLTWYNDQNFQTPYNQTGMAPGGHLDFIGWQNLTSNSISCAWYATRLAPSPTFGFGGLTVFLENRFDAAATIGFEGGGIFEGSANGESVMIDPPPLYFIPTSAGPTVHFVLLSLSGPAVYQQGYSTAGIGTSVLSAKQFNLTVGSSHNQAVGDPVLNLTTHFPLAWIDFFATSPAYFFNGPVKCVASTPAIQARCTTPPPGASVTLSVSLNVVAYTIDYLTVQIAVF